MHRMIFFTAPNSRVRARFVEIGEQSRGRVLRRLL